MLSNRASPFPQRDLRNDFHVPSAVPATHLMHQGQRRIPDIVSAITVEERRSPIGRSGKRKLLRGSRGHVSGARPVASRCDARDRTAPD
jgi:hypothetical protein